MYRYVSLHKIIDGQGLIIRPTERGLLLATDLMEICGQQFTMSSIHGYP